MVPSRVSTQKELQEALEQSELENLEPKERGTRAYLFTDVIKAFLDTESGMRVLTLGAAEQARSVYVQRFTTANLEKVQSIASLSVVYALHI